jgi:hypothetical protein
VSWVDDFLAGSGAFWPPVAPSSTGDTPTLTLVESSTVTKATTARLAPDGILTQTNLTGALTDIQDDPDSPDANYMNGVSGTSSTLRVSFPTPTQSLVAGFTQEFRVRIRPRP